MANADSVNQGAKNAGMNANTTYNGYSYVTEEL
jgi:hypothetical protein